MSSQHLFSFLNIKEKVFQVYRVQNVQNKNLEILSIENELLYKMCYHLFLTESIAILEVILLKEYDETS